MILCIQNKPGTFTRQDPRPPLRFPFSRAPYAYSSSQLPIASRTYVGTYVNVTNFRCTYHMRMCMQSRLGCRLPCLWLEKMSETSVKIINVRCRDDTVPKTIDTRKHCKVGLRACNNLPQPPPYIFVFRGCGRLLHALNPTLQCMLSCIYSFWHGVIPTSYFIFNDFYTCNSDGLGNWSSAGCSLIAVDEDNKTATCSCNHLTNFAILVVRELLSPGVMPCNIIILPRCYLLLLELFHDF